MEKPRGKLAYVLQEAAVDSTEAKSYTWAVRWAGEGLNQGRRVDGLPNAQACLNRVLIDEAKRARRSRRLEKIRDDDPLRRVLSKLTRPIQRRRLKPYGVFVAMPVYALMLSVTVAGLRKIPNGARVLLLLTLKRLVDMMRRSNIIG